VALLRAMGSDPIVPYVGPKPRHDVPECRDSALPMVILITSLAAALACASAWAGGRGDPPSALANGAGERACAGLPDHAALRGALTEARDKPNGGFGLDMWGAVVNRDGVVCAVAFTGAHRGDQWPGSRVIAAQKASTANAFSLPGLALSTANLWAAVQPGGSLYGLQQSNPVNTDAAYAGPASAFGRADDPLVGRRLGGVNVFGGGLPLYNAGKQLVGAIGVSGDDNINYRGIVAEPSMQADFSHPVCKIGGVDNVSSISAGLPAVRKVR
jgi:uncharacterized protein GlcG (DUF336 family)